jgi:hypothetical protein
MFDKRQNFRLRQQLEFKWSVPDQNIEGRGLIFDVSARGVLFETDKLFKPEHGLVMTFKVNAVPAFPAQGRLQWFKKIGGPPRDRYQCGVKFAREIAQGSPWTQWMEDNILKLADAQDNAILERYLGSQLE